MNRLEVRAGLDTSFLVRLLTGQPEPQATAALEYLAEADEAGARLAVSNLVISEADFACQHHYRMPKAEVLRGLESLLSNSIFVIQPDVMRLLSQSGMALGKPGFIDGLIHAEYAGSGLPLVTFEKSGSRLAGTRVIPATTS